MFPTEIVSALALFSPVELNLGALTPLVLFIWVGVNASLELQCGPGLPHRGSLERLSSELKSGLLV